MGLWPERLRGTLGRKNERFIKEFNNLGLIGIKSNFFNIKVLLKIPGIKNNRTWIEKVNCFLDEAKTFYFLTTDGDKPKGRPFGFHMLDRDRLYFGCGTFKNVFSQLTKNPHVEVMAVNGRDGFKDSRDDVFSNTVAACYFRNGK